MNRMPQAGAQIVVTGRVQGVGFRDFTTRVARSLGLVGTVRNLPDGDVRVDVEGEKSVIESLIARLNEGPSGSRVRDVRVTWHEPTGLNSRFEITF